MSSRVALDGPGYITIIVTVVSCVPKIVMVHPAAGRCAGESLDSQMPYPAVGILPGQLAENLHQQIAGKHYGGGDAAFLCSSRRRRYSARTMAIASGPVLDECHSGCVIGNRRRWILTIEACNLGLLCTSVCTPMPQRTYVLPHTERTL